MKTYKNNYMESIDFIKLAVYCVERYKESHNTDRSKYVNTLYVAIGKDNEVQCSMTPHILKNAEKCLLVHKRIELAVEKWYAWYSVECIDEGGCVFDGNLGGGFVLRISACGSFTNQIMSLEYNYSNYRSDLYHCSPPFEDHMNKIWELYSRLKNISSPTEIRLIADLFRKDEQILKLEKEIEDFNFLDCLLKQEKEQYKNLLEEVRNLLK